MENLHRTLEGHPHEKEGSQTLGCQEKGKEDTHRPKPRLAWSRKNDSHLWKGRLLQMRRSLQVKVLFTHSAFQVCG